MIHDIDAQLPAGADLFLLSQAEAEATVRHILEKVHLPVPVFLDNEGDDIGKTVYAQPHVGLPFGRAYVVDATGEVTGVFTGYSPGPVLQTVEASLP